MTNPYPERGQIPIRDQLARTYVVKIWTEPREFMASALELRGEVRSLPEGERWYFHDLDDLARRLRRELLAPGQDLGNE